MNLYAESSAVLAWLLGEAAVADRRAELDGMAAHWNRLRVTDGVLERAQRPFPGEPVRTLNALHLASALLLREAQPGLTLLSLDRRVRRAGVGLGFEVVPASAEADS